MRTEMTNTQKNKNTTVSVPAMIFSSISLLSKT